MQSLLALIRRHAMLVRYVLSGGAGAVAQVGTLALYVEVFGKHERYLTGVVLGFCVALAVTFPLQKRWTFASTQEGVLWGEFVRYTSIALGSLAINTGMMYVLVSGKGMWYLGAQVIVVMVVAFLSFLLNRHWTFR